jgi:hypothetical protein
MTGYNRPPDSTGHFEHLAELAGVRMYDLSELRRDADVIESGARDANRLPSARAGELQIGGGPGN